MKTDNPSRGISTTIFGVVVLVLLIIAASGFYLYSSKSATTTTETSFLTSTSVLTSTEISTTTATVSGTAIASLRSDGFVNGNLTTFDYTQQYVCTPAITTFVNTTEAANATKVTTCLVGAGKSSALSGAFPVFVLVPAFAGLSNFGVTALGATSQGYPVFNGQPVVTQCGAGGSPSACPDHPTYLYSPDFTAVEQHLGIKAGVFGLPEGVLPTPSHDHVAGYNFPGGIPWYGVVVLVFDPNIFPNAITGQCAAVVNSNLTAPTGNCLNSFSALTAAMDTHTTATAAANSTQNDPIYDTFGGVSAQVLIPGVTIVSNSSPANSNLFLYFSVAPANPIP